MTEHKPFSTQLQPNDRDVDRYARALALSAAPRQTPIHDRLLNMVYCAGLLAIFGWFASMVFDREVPMRLILREVANLGKQVRIGQRLLIHAVRERKRQCQLTRRWWLIDGGGRRIDYEPERFDTYGDLGRKEETIEPVIPIDAIPGRGLLKGYVAYDCNPLQRTLGRSIVTMLAPVEFEILPREARP